MNLTNLFIIGAPKCGTTSIHNLLASRDDILAPRLKEPHFFSPELAGICLASSLDEYNSLYDEAAHPYKYRLDSSVWTYLFPQALQKVYQYNPTAKIIFCIRNPFEMLPSLHSQLLYSRDENIPDFNSAWNCSQSRMNTNSLMPPENRFKESLYYHTVCKYSEAITLLQSLFGKNLHVIPFDLFTSDPKRLLSSLADFLGIDLQSTSLPRSNSKKQVLPPLISRLVIRQPSFIKNLAIYKSRALPNLRLNLKSKILGLGLNILPTTQIDPETLVSIRKTYDYEKKNLIKLLPEYQDYFAAWL